MYKSINISKTSRLAKQGDIAEEASVAHLSQFTRAKTCLRWEKCFRSSQKEFSFVDTNVASEACFAKKGIFLEITFLQQTFLD